GCDQTKPSITTGSLFEEMIDMVNLAKFPDPAYKTIQFSSYDHRSQIPGGPDWFANSDGFGGEPIPNFEEVLTEPDSTGVGEYLVCDVDGPGAIVRVWTASINGGVKVYIDGSKTAVFDSTAEMFFHRPYDHYKEFENINPEIFKKSIQQRDASYAPIPFNKHLRVVWRGNIKEIHFYQLQVRLYEKGTSIASFEPADLEKYSEIIDKTGLVLYDPDKNLKFNSEESLLNFTETLSAHQSKTVFEMEGEKAIEKFTIQLNADNIDLALRQTVLHIIYDNYPWGQVQSPLGDFFGAAPGINPYNCLPFTVKPDGTMICRFVMPFKESVKIILENKGEQEVSVKGSVLPMSITWNDNSMHFRAKWRVDHNILAHNTKVQDLPFLLANGKGLYVGTTSYLMNPADGTVPYGNWWGEGDEKIFVDNEKNPSTFGTGSEDYFNYSWSAPDIFYFPFCGQPRNDGPGNRGFVTNYRYHLLDALPFNENISFYMELFHHEPTPGSSYSRIGYHYAIPGLTDDHQPIMIEDVRDLKMPDNWKPAAVKGSRNSLFYSAENLLVNKNSIKLEYGNLWEGSKCLIWEPTKEGDKISFNIPVKTEGNKRVYMTATLSPESGKIKVDMDNQAVFNDNEINLYRPYRTLLRNFNLVTKELTTGKHRVTIEYKGTESGNKNPKIGIDFFWVQSL
ncbi:glycoside hydrolase family 172 protein, partial [Bacteroidota bacterium]